MEVAMSILPGSDFASEFHADYLWVVIVGFHLSFMFAYSMGANEVSNAFATSVGSKVISLRMAYALATAVESAGGILLGYKVLETLRFKVIDLRMYEAQPLELLLGQVAILGASATWMLVATMVGLPVASTHSHIGSIVGFSLVMRGMRGLHWDWVGKIVISWVVSPLLSGLVSAAIYILADIAVLRRQDSLKCGFRALPPLYFLVFAFNTFAVVFDGSKWLGFDRTPLWLALLAALGVGALSALAFQLVVRPYVVKWVEQQQVSPEEMAMGARRAEGELHKTVAGPKPRVRTVLRHQVTTLNWLLPNTSHAEDPRTVRLFSAIQVFTGCFTGFSHGSKDIPNTIAPLATLLHVYSTMRVPIRTTETPIWFLFYGSFATCVGFWALGHKVIRVVGMEFITISPYTGFSVELGAAITVLVASKLGIPVAMSLCIVGSVVAVGAVRGVSEVNWLLFRNVAIAWIVTAPLSAVLAAVFICALRAFFL